MQPTKRSIKTRFRYASIFIDLSLLITLTRWFIMQKVRRHILKICSDCL